MSSADEPDLPVSEPSQGVELRVRGLVQGVGFRPTVWRLAQAAGLVGEVLNDGEGVLIRAWGSDGALSSFEAALLAEPPPLARIDSIAKRPIEAAPTLRAFVIAASEAGAVATGIVADAATCKACLDECLDPASRRYRYAFTNCTHCGPRLSIIRAIPYDRESTSMAAFAMCRACRSEYESPSDRRFHAEPIACPECGPRVWVEDGGGREVPVSAELDAIDQAARLLAAGHIVAIKGIGGFHLACDAASPEAAARLRETKRRYHKPFALMARDLATIERYARVSAPEARMLASPAAPIVVLDRRADAAFLASEIAPGQTTLGFMLPYSPLHHILMQHLERPIVLTSGNVSDEPQCTGNEEARRKLAAIAGFFLMHDRDIVNRLDDSVARVIDGAPVVLRRARGMAPEPLTLAASFAGSRRVLALGAELKSTFALLARGQAIVSQHIGDLEDAATHEDFRKALELYRKTFAFTPDVIAVDKHPDYLSTKWGEDLASETGAVLRRVQHHHAHVAAVLAEHGVPMNAPPVLGIVLDGLGFGEDGTLWGGEFLLAGYRSCERRASFAPVPLIGGNLASREPWRNVFAHVEQTLGWTETATRHPDLEIVRLIEGKSPGVLQRMFAARLNSPPASSAGRLFDAVAAVLGLHPEKVSYEGQAAIELEALAETAMKEAGTGYPFDLHAGRVAELRWSTFWQALLADVARGTPKAVVAARAHQGVIEAVTATAIEILASTGVSTAVLSGGVFQNRLLLRGVSQKLHRHGRRVLHPARYPANDGAISLGQAVIAAATQAEI